MTFQNDWVMRQIEMMTRFIAKVLLKKETMLYEITPGTELKETDLLYRRLHGSLAQGQIGKAEDLLFDSLNPADPDGLALAVDFYHTLNQWSDRELEAADFSREEIAEGLQSVLKTFGIEIPVA